MEIDLGSCLNGYTVEDLEIAIENNEINLAYCISQKDEEAQHNRGTLHLKSCEGCAPYDTKN